jgi:hypothetical protein
MDKISFMAVIANFELKFNISGSESAAPKITLQPLTSWLRSLIWKAG